MNRPPNIHCLALNYYGVGPAKDKEPLYFVKSSNSFTSEGAIIKYPKNVKLLWSEVELGLVIAKDCFRIPESKAIDYIKGFVVCGDLSCSNIYSRDHHLAFSKSREGFCPTSDLNSNKNIDLSDLKMHTKINGKITQTGSTSSMILNVFKCLSYVSHITRLEESDILITGTPPGWEKNFLKAGDKVTHEIEKIGKVGFFVE